MSIRPPLPALAALFLLAGCNQSAAAEDASMTDTKVKQNSTNETAVSRARVAEPSLSDAALLRKGTIVFLRCRSCHTTEEGGPHLTGPNLNGLFGAKAGTKQDYAFSEAMISANIVWNATTLDEWIRQPSVFMPQNRMVFAGLPNAGDRAALIAFLEEATQ